MRSVTPTFIKEKRQRLAFSLLLACLGLILGSAGIVIWASPPKIELESTSVTAELLQRCTIRANRYGATTTHIGDELHVVLNRTGKGSRDVLTEASIIIAGCHGFHLVEFCYGSECQDSDAPFILKAN